MARVLAWPRRLQHDDAGGRALRGRALRARLDRVRRARRRDARLPSREASRHGAAGSSGERSRKRSATRCWPSRLRAASSTSSPCRRRRPSRSATASRARASRSSASIPSPRSGVGSVRRRLLHGSARSSAASVIRRSEQWPTSASSVPISRRTNSGSVRRSLAAHVARRAALQVHSAALADRSSRVPPHHHQERRSRQRGAPAHDPRARCGREPSRRGRLDSLSRPQMRPRHRAQGAHRWPGWLHIPLRREGRWILVRTKSGAGLLGLERRRRS